MAGIGLKRKKKKEDIFYRHAMTFCYPGKATRCQWFLSNGKSMWGHAFFIIIIIIFVILMQGMYTNSTFYFSFAPSTIILWIFLYTQQGFRIVLTRLASHLYLQNIMWELCIYYHSLLKKINQNISRVKYHCGVVFFSFSLGRKRRVECHTVVTNEDDLSPCAFMICQYLCGNKTPITQHSIARACCAS